MKKMIFALVMMFVICSFLFANAEQNSIRINEGSNPNVRSSPSGDSEKIGVAKSGQIYDLLEISENGWYLIQLESGKTGWISGKMAEIVGSSTISQRNNETQTNAQETAPAKVVYPDEKGNEYFLEWGLSPKDLSKEPEEAFSVGKMPYWSDPSSLTPQNSGYYGAFYCEPFKGIKIDGLELYCAYQYSDTGFDTSMDKAQLYLAAYYCTGQIENSRFQSLINEFTREYGKPRISETSTTESMIYNFRPMKITTYYRSYIWKCGNNTGIHIKEQHGEQNSNHSNVVIYIGKTNMDASLREGKLSNGPTYIQTSVRAETISLKDENGKYKKTLAQGTTLTVTGYNKNLDLFSIQFSESKTGKETSGGSLYIYATTQEEEGYINGNGLSVSRSELLDHFQ